MKIIYMLLGFSSFFIGIIGIILPILPTTPFLLLSGFFFTKSSEKLRLWFISTKIYNKYLKEFAENREMKRSRKWALMLFVDIMMIITFFTISSVALRVLIVLLEVGKYYYFTFHVKTI